MNSDKRTLYVVDGLRTPFAPAGRELAGVGADELGRLICRRLMSRHPAIAARIAEVVFGCVASDSRALNVARVIGLRSGVPREVPGVTVQRNCASGMEALAQVFHRADRGAHDAFLVGGTESMSSYPFHFSDEMKALFERLGRAGSLLARARIALGFRPRFLKPRIALLEGLTDPVCGLSMGRAAENLAREFGITRVDQDAFALRSHQLADKAQSNLRDESILVVHENGTLRDDAGIRRNPSMEALAGLRSIFARQFGTVTAGNACPVSDGAAALLVCGEEALPEHQKPLGVVRDCVTVGLAPSRMGLGPAYAIARLLERNDLAAADVGLYEINEAFAAQVLACLRALASRTFCRRELKLSRAIGEIPLESLNVNGGAIALGHPVGASGARLLLTLLKEMHRRQVRYGIAALCVGGGQGSAVLLERTESP